MAAVVKVVIVDLGACVFFLFAGGFDKEVDAHAFGDVEDVFVFAAIGGGFFLFAVAVQVEDVDVVVGLHQVVAHAAMDKAVEIAVGVDKGEDAAAVFGDVVLGGADEFDVVVVEPFAVALFEPAAAVGLLFVVFHQFHYPCAFVLAFAVIRGIAKHDHDGGVAFDGVGFVGFGGEPLGKQGVGVGMVFFEGVGKEHIKAAGLFRLPESGFLKYQIKFEVGDGVAGHHELEAVEAGDEVLLGVALPQPLLGGIALVDVADDFGKEGAGAGGGVEDLQAVDFFVGADGFAPAAFGLFGGGNLHFDGGFAVVAQPLGDVQMGFEGVIGGADDKLHGRLRGVPYTVDFTQFWVVFGKEGFVEVDKGVVGLGVFAEVFEDVGNVGGAEDVGQGIDYPDDAGIEPFAGNGGEEIA